MNNIKIRLKDFLLILVGLLISLTIGVTAANTYKAKLISYTKDGTTVDVQFAIEELYKEAKDHCPSGMTCVTESEKELLKNKYINDCPSGKICFTPISSAIGIGDYIYLKPTSTSYTITPNMTGYSSNQTLNPSELDKWRVIRKNDDGTIDIVSDRISSSTVYFNGIVGYQSYIGTLNTIAAQYAVGNNNLVQSARHMGYDGESVEYITNTTYLQKTTVPWTTSATTETTKADQLLGKGKYGTYRTDFDLVAAIYDGSAIGKTPSGSQSFNWLATQYYSYSSSSGEWNFYIVGKNLVNGTFAHSLIRNGVGQGPTNSSVRPILTIKSSAKIISGSGTESTPYQLGL